MFVCGKVHTLCKQEMHFATKNEEMKEEAGREERSLGERVCLRAMREDSSPPTFAPLCVYNVECILLPYQSPESFPYC